MARRSGRSTLRYKTGSLVIDLASADDAWIYQQIAEGGDDPRLWRVFLERFQSPAYRVIRRTLLRRMGSETVGDLADELFQSFFLSLLANERRLLTRYRGDRGCTPRTYICYLAGYHVLTELRTRRNIPDLLRGSFESLDDPDHPSFRSVPEPSPVEVAASREMLREAVSGLESLSEIDRRIFRMIYVENRSFKEIAEVTGDSLTTVRVQHHRLRKRLRGWLIERGHLFEDEAEDD